MSDINPFMNNGYRKPKYFCDRKAETEYLINKISQNQNVFIHGNRGIGKTSLIKHVFYMLQKKEAFNLVYIDLSKLLTLTQINKKIHHFIYSKFGIKLGEKNFSNNSLTDTEIAVEKSETEKVVKLLSFLEKNGIQITLALDNFYNGDKLLTEQFENLILSYYIKSKNVQIIFSGTKISNLTYFENTLELDIINSKDLSEFINKIFNNSKRKIKKNAIKRILLLTSTNINYVQVLCSRLWELNYKNINEKKVNLVFNQIIREYEPVFLLIQKLLSSYQWRLLQAIALEGIAEQITSVGFINKYFLNAPSSVKTAVDALLEKELIMRIEKSYKLTDPILRKYLILQYF